jgi:glycosyltransferase involved in cell wall biosynthesis
VAGQVAKQAQEVAVSVVIPTRDRWGLLATTLESVLEQRGVGFEVVIVDDGSQEHAPPIAPFDDPRVRILRHHRSRGVASARNAGIDAARGGWIAFLDDDDIWAPDKLRSQLDVARSAGASFAYASVLLVREDTGAVARAEAPPADRLSALLRAYNAVPAGASNLIVEAKLVRAVGGFDPGLSHLADWDLWIRLADEGRGAACPKPLVGYRLHPSSMRSTAGGVLRELRRVDSKHGRRRSVPSDRGWLYRWLAEGQLMAGRRGAAALAYTRGAVRFRSRSDLLLAVGALLTGGGACVLGHDGSSGWRVSC